MKKIAYINETPKAPKAKKKKPSATLEDVAKKKILQTITRERDTGRFQEAEDYF